MHLLIDISIIDYNQYSSTAACELGQNRPVHLHPLILPDRYVLAWHTQSPQHVFQYIGKIPAPFLVISEHVREQHSASKPPARERYMRGLYSQFSLAYPAQAADRNHHHRGWMFRSDQA